MVPHRLLLNPNPENFAELKRSASPQY